MILVKSLFKSFVALLILCTVVNNEVSSANSFKLHPRSFISEIEWAPPVCPFWNANGWVKHGSVVNLMVSITSGVSLWYRPCYKK